MLAVYRADVRTEVVVAVGCFSTGLLFPVSQLFMKCTVTKLHVSIVLCYAACLSFPSPQRKMCSEKSAQGLNWCLRVRMQDGRRGSAGNKAVSSW